MTTFRYCIYVKARVYNREVLTLGKSIGSHDKIALVNMVLEKLAHNCSGFFVCLLG